MGVCRVKSLLERGGTCRVPKLGPPPCCDVRSATRSAAGGGGLRASGGARPAVVVVRCCCDLVQRSLPCDALYSTQHSTALVPPSIHRYLLCAAALSMLCEANGITEVGRCKLGPSLKAPSGVQSLVVKVIHSAFKLNLWFCCACATPLHRGAAGAPRRRSAQHRDVSIQLPQGD